MGFASCSFLYKFNVTQKNREEKRCKASIFFSVNVYLVDYRKLIIAVNIVEPAMAISINQTTTLVTLENVLVFLSFIDSTHPYSLLTLVYIVLQKSATKILQKVSFFKPSNDKNTCYCCDNCNPKKGICSIGEG